ncbi:MAG TPA: hypothetical protein VIV40_28365 [Kofleriaceae bacterium]
MGKWLAAATVAVLALLALLWMQIREPAAAVAPAPKRDVAQAAAPTQLATANDLALAAKKVREAQAQSGKLDPASDGFTYHFDEAITPAATMNAAKCYTGGLNRVHRNQKTKLGYKVEIKNGVVTLHDVKVIETTINDKALNDCFVREVAKTTWNDDALPDWAQDDELLIRPERGMKKFTKENLDYEGEGPIGKLESPGKVAASREQPLDERAP